MKRKPDFDEDDFEEDEHTRPSVQRPPRSVLQLISGTNDRAVGSDLVLIQQSAQLQADLQVAREQLETLESRQKWLWGGLAVSSVLLVLCAMHKRRPPTSSAIGTVPPRGQS